MEGRYMNSASTNKESVGKLATAVYLIEIIIYT